MKSAFVYILSNTKNGTIYIGVTNDLIRRVYEHKHAFVEGFTKKYRLKNLVYYEVFDDISNAILREKQIKKWNRAWKIKLFESLNPDWIDLYPELLK